MALDTVSTYSVFQSTLGNMSKVETELNQQQIQLSSGSKSQDFTGMASQAQQFLSLDAVIAKTDQYLNNNQIVETRINTTSSVLDQVISVGNTLQNLISQRRSGTGNGAAFGLQLTGLWQQLTGQLNTSVDNQYLFSGTKTNEPAVDTENFPTTVEPGVPDAGYYRGSTQDITVRAQDSTLVTYNVRADADAFQKIFAGLAMAKQADQSNADGDFVKAYDLVNQGLQGVVNIQSTVNANKVQFTTIDQNLQNVKLYWKGIQDSIGNTDILAVSTQVAINQGILQAAFQAFAKITSLRLSDFLR